MLKKVRQHIQDHFPFLLKSKLLVACSGGVDSVTLAFILKELQCEIGLAHANFALRGKESDADEDFVIDLAEKWNVPVFAETFDTKGHAATHKLSTQMAARELRYQWFREMATDFRYDYIVIAHHADDDLETFLINLSRGTGLQGLTGIPAINDQIARPLLPFSRDEILVYAKELGLFWREDSSNQKKDYLRNQLRHNAIPPLKEATTSFLDNFQKTQQHLQGARNLVGDYMDLVSRLLLLETEQGVEIDLQKLSELPHQEALLYELLHPFGFTAWEDINQLPKAQSGKQIFSKTHRLLKDRNVILLTEVPSKEKNEKKTIGAHETQIDFPLKMSFIPTDKMGYIDNKTIYVDLDAISFPLELRKWQEGDIFQPFGMKGKKKLSKFFKDEKLSLAAKEQIWVLLSHGQIVWVVGHRLDERFKVNAKTEHILKISLAS